MLLTEGTARRLPRPLRPPRPPRGAVRLTAAPVRPQPAFHQRGHEPVQDGAGGQRDTKGQENRQRAEVCQVVKELRQASLV